MGELRMDPDELKKLIKVGKQRPLPFAFCPGGGDEEDLLVIHRKKAPDRLSKAARKDSGGVKVAFGTFQVDGKVMTVTAEKLLPALGKQIKKYLRTQKLAMDVIVLDADGNEVGA